VKSIPLTRGRVAIVDDEDYEFLAQFRWRWQNTWGAGYAVRSVAAKPTAVLMHREVLHLSRRDAGLHADHINGNGLDNRRANLRVVTPAQNRENLRPYRNGTSRYRGVYWHAGHQRWRACVRHNGRDHHAGYFQFEDEAGAAAVRLRQQLMTHNVENELSGLGMSQTA
jgi:hypothetical protein